MGPLNPQPHLLVEIVVKQDQVEVSLQALQRPLPDTVLAAASLRRGWVVKTGFRGHPVVPIPGKGQDLSLRNPWNTIYPSLYNTVLPGWKFFPASNIIPWAAINLWPRGSCW